VSTPLPRLGVIVPYRDRAEHLSQLLPHMAAYFSRDKIDKEIPVTLAIVEQPAGLTFNRGLIKNIGFKALRDKFDYVCFHDVDYLPIWADFRPPDLPTMLIWHGYESQVIDPSQPQMRVWFALEKCFGAIILVRNEQFERVNGFSNQYWGWGEEDNDLRLRFERIGLKTQHRKGTFSPLLHRHEGYDLTRRPTEANLRNASLIKSKWETPTDDWRDDGLSNTQFAITRRTKIELPPGTRDSVQAEHILVAFEHKPPPGH
jgi:glycosyl transferase family 7 (putative galactosyltransferase)